MLVTLAKLWWDESGFIVSSELVLVSTCGVLCMLVGLNEVAVAVNAELNDVSNAFGALNQGYSFTGFAANSTTPGGTVAKSGVNGSHFIDDVDICDIGPIQLISIGYGGTDGNVPAGA